MMLNVIQIKQFQNVKQENPDDYKYDLYIICVNKVESIILSLTE